MPLPSELDFTNIVSAFIVERLSADSALTALVGSRIFDTDIPQADSEAEKEALYPCIVFGPPVFGPLLFANGHEFVWAPMNVPIRAINRAMGFDSLVPIAIRIRQDLHGASGDVAGGGSMNSCRYIRPIKEAPPTSEESYKHLGGLFYMQPKLSAA